MSNIATSVEPREHPCTDCTRTGPVFCAMCESWLCREHASRHQRRFRCLRCAKRLCGVLECGRSGLCVPCDRSEKLEEYKRRYREIRENLVRNFGHVYEHEPLTEEKCDIPSTADPFVYQSSDTEEKPPLTVSLIPLATKAVAQIKEYMFAELEEKI